MDPRLLSILAVNQVLLATLAEIVLTADSIDRERTARLLRHFAEDGRTAAKLLGGHSEAFFERTIEGLIAAYGPPSNPQTKDPEPEGSGHPLPGYPPWLQAVYENEDEGRDESEDESEAPC